MQIKSKVKFHNRFDIEVIREGVVIQKGFAENIVLDQAYTRLCALSSFFVNIHYGTGNGTLESTRTTLFTHLGTKIAETTETIRALPTSKWTRKITLNPSDNVGATLTEVGVAFGSTNTNLITHAMIKDAEGNPLTLTKTDLDVIVIYATIFATLNDNTNTRMCLNSIISGTVNYNELIMYFTGGSYNTTSAIELDLNERDTNALSTIHFITSKSPTVVAETVNRKRKYSTRFEITEGNTYNQVKTLSLNGICRYTPVPSVDFVNKIIGVGDGLITQFPVIPEIMNPVFKRNSTIDGNVVISGTENPTKRLSILAFMEYPVVGKTFLSWVADPFATGGQSWFSYTDMGTWKNTESLLGKKIFLDALGNSNNDTGYLYLDSSIDGVTWTTRLSRGSRASSGRDVQSAIVTWDDLFYRVRMSSYGLGVRMVWIEDPLNSAPIATFATPPALGETVSVSGKVNYFPKSTDYVLDVSFEIQFGEGV